MQLACDWWTQSSEVMKKEGGNARYGFMLAFSS